MEKTFKIAMIGDCMVGKSSLLSREIYGDYLDKYEATIAVGFCSKRMVYYNKKIKLNVWDLSGDDRFVMVIKTYLKHIQGVFIVYDVTNINSFKNVKYWVDLVKSFQINDLIMILLANKIDKEEKRVISVDMGIKYALKHKMVYLDVSAKTGTTMNFLNMLTEMLMEKHCIKTKIKKKIKVDTLIHYNNEILLNGENTNYNIRNTNDHDLVKWCSCDIF